MWEVTGVFVLPAFNSDMTATDQLHPMNKNILNTFGALL